MPRFRFTPTYPNELLQVGDAVYEAGATVVAPEPLAATLRTIPELVELAEEQTSPENPEAETGTPRQSLIPEKRRAK
jgi:hypothetical protein